MADINNTTSYTLLSGTNDADTIKSLGSNVTIDGGKGDDSITNGDVWTVYQKSYLVTHSGDNISINANAGNDSILNGGDNVTIRGGAGNDLISLQSYASLTVIEYTAGDGNDSIVGFNEDDTLRIAASKYSTKKSGDDIIVTVGKGKITLAGAASLSAVNIDFDKLLLVDNKTSSPVTVDSKTKIIDASARTTAVKITGNAGDNTIKGGAGKDTLSGSAGNDSLWGGAGNDKLYGEAGNDTLWGGTGNDTLYGGDGNDVFIYQVNEGKDYIKDFTAGDLLQILNADGSEGSFTNSSFKSGKLTLAIEGGGHVVFSGMNAGDAVNINGTMHTISGSKLR